MNTNPNLYFLKVRLSYSFKNKNVELEFNLEP